MYKRQEVHRAFNQAQLDEWVDRVKAETELTGHEAWLPKGRDLRVKPDYTLEGRNERLKQFEKYLEEHPVDDSQTISSESEMEATEPEHRRRLAELYKQTSLSDEQSDDDVAGLSSSEQDADDVRSSRKDGDGASASVRGRRRGSVKSSSSRQGNDGADRQGEEKTRGRDSELQLSDVSDGDGARSQRDENDGEGEDFPTESFI